MDDCSMTSAEVREKFAASNSVIVSEYRGLTVGALATLRRALRPLGAEYKVYKNTLVKIAARDGEMAAVESMAVKLGMKKLKLTVFKSNRAALDFYGKKLGYVVDGTSPSQHRLMTECYEILSKEVVNVGKA